MANDSSFNVMEMAKAYAGGGGEDFDVKQLFIQHPVSGKVREEAGEELMEEAPKGPVGDGVTFGSYSPEDKVEPKPAKKGGWTPDPSLMEGMEEFQPVVFNKEDVHVEAEDKTLRNITDDTAIEMSRETMDELQWKLANIERAKARHGIAKFQIPEGEYHVRVHSACITPDYKKAQANLDEIFNEIKDLHPEFILEWAEGAQPPAPEATQQAAPAETTGNKIIELPKAAPVVTQAPEAPPPKEEPAPAEPGETTVIIDKSQLPQISWSTEDLDKIRRSRTVHLDIVETMPLEYAEIEEIHGNAVDAVLETYQRKSNDIVAALPASNYRATFTGLTYTEVVDLSNSQELNNLDGERKKWSIAFKHIKNPSIGPWREYKWYIDPKSKKRVEVPITAMVPSYVEDHQVHVVTKFEDFMRKTSFIDLEFILWKILCATAMDQEIISIDCRSMVNGRRCGKTYDWIYCPNELLLLDTVEVAVMEDMKKSCEVSTKDDIMAHYMRSMLNVNNTSKLPSSGLRLVFGHISAYRYIEEGIWQAIKDLEAIVDTENQDPETVSRSMTYTTLTVVKGFLVPKAGGGFSRISDTEDMIKVLESLDEIDFQAVGELVRIMVNPYQFKFALRDIVCPACHSKSSIPIDSMSRMLFIVARSLSSVQVVLTRT